MLDFPAFPTNGQIFDAPNGVTYAYQMPPGRWNDGGVAVASFDTWITPEMFGASSSLDDNAVPLQVWIDALIATGQPGLWLESYKSSAGLVVNGSVTIQCGPNTVFDIRGASTGAIAISVNGGFNAAAGVALIGPIALGTKTLPCAPGAETQFTVGCLVKINSADLFDPARGHTWKGELAWVESVASGAVTLETTTMDSYTTSPRLHLVTPARFSISGGLRIIGTKNAAHTQQGIICTHVANSLIAGVTCEGISSLNFSLNNAIDSEIVRCNAIDALHGITGYGIGLSNATQGCHISWCRATNVRHATTIGGDAYTTAAPNPNPLGGVCRDCTIEKVRGVGVRNDGIDTHGNVDRLTLRDIVVSDCGGQGVNTEGGSITADGVVIRRAVLGGFNVSSGAGEVKTNISARNILVEDCGGVGINFGTAPHPDYPPGTPRPEPAGLGTVHLSDFHVVRSVATGLRITRPDTYANTPEVVKVSAGRLDACGTTLCAQFDFIQNFQITGLSFLDVPTGAKAIGLVQARRGAVRDITAVFLPGATNSGLGLTDCIDVSYGGIKLTAPSAVSLRGVTFDGGASGIRSLGDNDFKDCSLPYTLTTLPVVAGVVTLPGIVTGLVYRIGDGVTPVSVTSIVGGGRSDVVTLCGINAVGAVTFRHGTGNLRMRDGRDVLCNSSEDAVTFSYDDTIVDGWRQVNLTETETDVLTASANLALGIEHDRKTLNVSSASAVTVTLPSTFQVGFRCQVVQIAAGQAVFAAAAGGVLRHRSSHTKTLGLYAGVTLTVIKNTGGAAAEWLLTGDTVA